MSLSRFLLRLFGWKAQVSVPDYPKAIICVAPHTSNWDFVLGELAIHAVGRTAGFLMKAEWFVWPLGPMFRALGGVPVERRDKKVSLVDVLVRKFKSVDRLVLAITPEGTRSRTSKWHTGFLQIAHQAGVPVELGVIDAATKTVSINDTFTPTGDPSADIAAIKRYYAPFEGIHPEKFSIDPQ